MVIFFIFKKFNPTNICIYIYIHIYIYIYMENNHIYIHIYIYIYIALWAYLVSITSLKKYEILIIMKNKTEGYGCHTSEHIQYYTLFSGWLYLQKWELCNFFECGNVKFTWEEMGGWGETEIECSRIIINRKFSYVLRSSMKSYLDTIIIW